MTFEKKSGGMFKTQWSWNGCFSWKIRLVESLPDKQRSFDQRLCARDQYDHTAVDLNPFLEGLQYATAHLDVLPCAALREFSILRGTKPHYLTAFSSLFPFLTTFGCLFAVIMSVFLFIAAQQRNCIPLRNCPVWISVSAPLGVGKCWPTCEVTNFLWGWL